MSFYPFNNAFTSSLKYIAFRSHTDLPFFVLTDLSAPLSINYFRTGISLLITAIWMA